MKKSALVILFAGMMLGPGAQLAAAETCKPAFGTVVLDKLLMYFPNRLMDCLDIITGSLETGPQGKIGIRFTHAFGFGAEAGYAGKLTKGFNRTVGGSLNEDNQAYFCCVGVGNVMQECAFGNLPEYWYHYSGMLLPDNQLVFQSGDKDYWALEFKAAALVGVEIGIHPLNIADFVCGVFCCDLLGNDYHVLY